MEHDKGILKRLNSPNSDLLGLCLLNIKTYIFAILVVGLLAVGYATAHYGYIQGIALGLLPIGLYIALIGLQKPKATFYAFFVLNYFLMGIGRYSMGSNFPFGTLIDATIVYMFLVLLVQRVFTSGHFQWRNINNIFTYLSLVWLLYCFSEFFNPLCLSTSAWSSSIRGIAFYMFAVACIAPVILNKFKDLKTLMFIWSILTVIAVCKAMMQKFIGFDFAESYWLFVLGGQLTHIIGYGVRYFSFFTDAANFGAGIYDCVFYLCPFCKREITDLVYNCNVVGFLWNASVWNQSCFSYSVCGICIIGVLI
jgi:teichuronic acid biosynthesis protein TuaE